VDYLLHDKTYKVVEQIGKYFFKYIILNNSKRQTIQDNIHRAGNRITGCGWGWSLMHECTAHGFNLAVQLLLDKGMNIDAICNSGTSLIVVVEYGHLKTVELLLNSGSKVEAKRKDSATALCIAVSNGYEQCVELLLKKGANTEAQWKGQTPLLIAVIHGHESIVQLLLDRGANIEVQSSMGIPLIEACWGGSEGII